jgi:hypothetical protein
MINSFIIISSPHQLPLLMVFPSPFMIDGHELIITLNFIDNPRNPLSTVTHFHGCYCIRLS